jgi:hypothetical protein
MVQVSPQARLSKEITCRTYHALQHKILSLRLSIQMTNQVEKIPASLWSTGTVQTTPRIQKSKLESAFAFIDPHAFVSSWSFKRKWAATAIVSGFTFISPVSSSMVAPATNQLAAQLGIHSSVIIAFTTSIFVLASGESIFVVSDPCLTWNG